jgi:hypothetical protein
MPLGLVKVVIFEYTEVALGLLVVNDVGVAGSVSSKRKVWRRGPNRPWGSIARGMTTMLRVRSSPTPIIVSPTVMMPVVGSVLLLRPIFFFSYFCRCVSALAVTIVVISGEVGLRKTFAQALHLVLGQIPNLVVATTTASNGKSSGGPSSESLDFVEPRSSPQPGRQQNHRFLTLTNVVRYLADIKNFILSTPSAEPSHRGDGEKTTFIRKIGSGSSLARPMLRTLVYGGGIASPMMPRW